MLHFTQPVEQMSLKEAEEAYEHVTRNMYHVHIEEIEANPDDAPGDMGLCTMAKKILRRIRELKR